MNSSRHLPAQKVPLLSMQMLWVVLPSLTLCKLCKCPCARLHGVLGSTLSQLIQQSDRQLCILYTDDLL